LLHLVGSSVLLYLIDDARSNKNQAKESFYGGLSTGIKSQNADRVLQFAFAPKEKQYVLTCSSYFSANSTELITAITLTAISIKTILLRNFLLTSLLNR